MRYLSPISAFIILLVQSASAQNINIPQTNFNPLLVKYIELTDIPNHVGDTVCVYGHVHDFKTLKNSNTITVIIDSASNGRFVNLELSYSDPEAIPYVINELKNNIIIYGVITGNRDSPKIVSQLFLPEDGTGSELEFFRMMLNAQRHKNRNPKSKITNVVLTAPSGN